MLSVPSSRNRIFSADYDIHIRLDLAKFVALQFVQCIKICKEPFPYEENGF